MDTVNRNITKLEKAASSIIQSAGGLIDYKARVAEFGENEDYNTVISSAEASIDNYTAFGKAFETAFIKRSPQDLETKRRDIRLLYDRAVINEMEFLYCDLNCYDSHTIASVVTADGTQALFYGLSAASDAIKQLEKVISLETSGTAEDTRAAKDWRKASQLNQQATHFAIKVLSIDADSPPKKIHECKIWQNAFYASCHAATNLETAIEEESKGMVKDNTRAQVLRNAAQQYQQASDFFAQAATAFNIGVSKTIYDLDKYYTLHAAGESAFRNADALVDSINNSN